MTITSLDCEDDNYHLGHLIIDVMKNRPNEICQIDAATGESETNASVLSRSIQLARCLRRFGMKPGDVMALGGRNHNDLHIPHYAALMNGIPVAGVDPLLKYNDIKIHFRMCEPKIIFCQTEAVVDYLQAIRALGLETKVVSFDDGAYSMKKFIEKYDDNGNDDEFEPAIFDLDKIYVSLMTTGGTTGVMKQVAFKHKVWVNKMLQLRAVFQKSTRCGDEKNTPSLHLAPVQWISGLLNLLAMPILHLTKVQTSGPKTTAHIIDVINKYRPVSVIMTSMLLDSIFEDQKECDFTCFDSVMVGGTKIPKNTYTELRRRMRPDAFVIETYGQTENLGPVFMPLPNLPIGSCGNGKYSWHKLKLVDTESGKEITKPYVPGELLTKGPCFSEYHKNPKLTASAFTKDGWFKTGDFLFMDEHDNYFFVERIQMMINGQPSAPLIEEVIRSHPGVRDVCVTSVRLMGNNQEDAIACVVRKPESKVTAKELKDLVATKLPESQSLRGGIVFLAEIPLTSTGKIAYGKVTQIAFTSPRE